MQLMPATASRLGVRDAFDAVANLDGGARHLRYLLDRYAGDVALALAAYNAGEAAVDLYGGVPPYPETRAYVRRVLDWAGRAREGTGTRSALYRYERPDGTLVYSNLPPPGPAPALTPRRP
jgi:soluble lytic murein transglycosylase-like protein